MRVVLDTNVVVSAIISSSGPPALIRSAWRDDFIQVVVTSNLIAEYRRALSYPKIASQFGLSNEEIDEIGEEFFTFGTHVEDLPIEPVVKDDPDDDVVIACAIAGSADYIITGDRHLLSIREYQGIFIVSPAAFLSLMNV